jgi:hypothetical protein
VYSISLGSLSDSYLGRHCEWGSTLAKRENNKISFACCYLLIFQASHANNFRSFRKGSIKRARETFRLTVIEWQETKSKKASYTEHILRRYAASYEMLYAARNLCWYPGRWHNHAFLGRVVSGNTDASFNKHTQDTRHIQHYCDKFVSEISFLSKMTTTRLTLLRSYCMSCYHA